MLKRCLTILSLSLTTLVAVPALAAEQRVALETSRGVIEVELDAEHAPATVENFLSYVDQGFYTGTLFHRVIPGFMIQGGGFDGDFAQKPTQAPVRNESGNGLANRRGTIAMARTANPDSATSQFFINLVDNANLDGAAGRPGYTVFGRVVSGMEVVDAIAQVPTTRRGPHTDVPATPIEITSARLLD
ncbi:peptidylprolyl isomerase [Halotalea alkalilenta]|uniref:Peptidyl-prolyl cis-trans isomerase n=1 Tax=Halotalea alkalilenta TaxID=376489 RepID=A0A172YHY4_9GAMM|nr:peptidylprolyl isomerase [Halotalea alkalilenta]ANF58854.1 peptidylprolyl isomerase [Halotalea alkalilenta]